MAIQNPPAYMQGRTDHSAASFRQALAALGSAEGGVNGPGSLAVSERGAGANMSVDIAPGIALVPDNQPATGLYSVANDAITNVAIAASDTLDRIDIVGIRVQDNTDNAPDVIDEAGFEIITGTPGGTAPAIPGTYQFLPLAEITVPANATSILDGDITDVRPFQAAASPSYEQVVFTSSGTFRPADYPWAKQVRVRVIGGGGGSGLAAATGAGEIALGGSGGGGGYAEASFGIDSVPADAVVTVGTGGAAEAAGGESSFHTLVAADGGAAGGNGGASTAITTNVPGAPGEGGLGTAGDILARGSDAVPAMAQATSRLYPGLSGASALGGSVSRGVVNGTYPGETGSTYGGGAGAPVNSPSQALQPGAAGGNGVVIIEIFG